MQGLAGSPGQCFYCWSLQTRCTTCRLRENRRYIGFLSAVSFSWGNLWCHGLPPAQRPPMPEVAGKMQLSSLPRVVRHGAERKPQDLYWTSEQHPHWERQCCGLAPRLLQDPMTHHVWYIPCCMTWCNLTNQRCLIGLFKHSRAQRVKIPSKKILRGALKGERKRDWASGSYNKKVVESLAELDHANKIK